MGNQQQLLLETAKELINSNKLYEAEQIISNLNNKYSVFELAKIRKIQGRNREAEQLYLKSLSMTSDIKSHIDSDINVELGRIYASFGKVKEAISRYEKGMDIMSSEKNIYKELGNLYLSVKNYEDAEFYLQKSLTLFPDDIMANLSLAIVYKMEEKDDLAKKIFLKLLAIKELKTNKHLYNMILNEYEILMRKEYLESKPREIRATITNKCNIGCRYCDIWKCSNWQQSEERMKEIMGLFPYMDNVYWLGGETFLYKGFEEVLEEGSKFSNLHQTIFTNGLLLNERVLEKIAKGNIKLYIAIDAGKKETYEYLRRGSDWNKLCEKLELIKEIRKKTNKSIETIYNMVVSRTNYKELFDVVELAKKYEFNRIRLMPILGGWKEENIFSSRDIEALNYIKEVTPLIEKRCEEYGIVLENNLPTKEGKSYKDLNLKVVKDGKYDLIKTTGNVMRCVIPWKLVVLDSKGLMRACANSNDWLGNSKKQTISEFWNSENMQTFRKHFGNMYACTGDNLNAGPGDIAFTPT